MNEDERSSQGRFDGRRNATDHGAAYQGSRTRRAGEAFGILDPRPRQAGRDAARPIEPEPIGSLRLRSSASLCTTVSSVISVTSVNSHRAALLRTNENRGSRRLGVYEVGRRSASAGWVRCIARATRSCPGHYHLVDGCERKWEQYLSDQW